MKKFFIILLSTLLICFCAFNLVACNKDDDSAPNPVSSKELLTGLIDDEFKNFELTLSMEKGTIQQNNATAYISLENGLDADLYAQNYLKNPESGAISNQGAVMFFRNGNFYVSPIGTNLTTNDYVSALKSKMEDIELYPNGNIVNSVLEDFCDDVLGDIYEEIFVLEENLNITYEEFSTAILKNADIERVLKTLAVNYIVFLSDNPIENNGYTVAIDINKFLDKMEIKLGEIATYIDANTNITINELYNSQPVKDLLNPLVEGLTGKDIETVLKAFVSIADNDNLNLSEEIFTANNENAYDYIGKYLNKKIDGITLGALKLEDFIGKITGNNDYVLSNVKTQLEESIDDIKQNISETLPNNLILNINFDKDKNLIDFNTKFKINIPDENNSSLYYEWEYEYNIKKLSSKPVFYNISTNGSIKEATNIWQDYINLTSFYKEFSSMPYSEYEDFILNTLDEKYDCGISYLEVLLTDTYLKSFCQTTQKTLRIGVNAEYEPFEYYDNNELKGFDIEFINEIARQLDVNVEFINDDFETLISGLDNGEYDIVISAMVLTEDRKQNRLASNAYFSSVYDGDYVIYSNKYLDKLITGINTNIITLTANGFVDTLIAKYNLNDLIKIDINSNNELVDVITNQDILYSYLNYGWIYESYGYDRYEVVDLICTQYIEQAIISQYALQYYENKSPNTSIEKWNYDRYLTEEEIIEYEYLAIKSFNDSITSLEGGEIDMESTLTIEQKREYINNGIDIGSENSTRRTAYNALLNELVEIGEMENISQDFSESNYYKRILKVSKNSVLVGKLINELGETAVETIISKYNNYTYVEYLR